MLYQKNLDIVDILQNNMEPESKTFEIEQPEVSLSKLRENTISYTEPLYEKKFFNYVKEGKTAELIKHMLELPKDQKIGVLSKKSQLQNLKNYAIVSIALSTRAAMEGGLNYNIAYALSDLFIQKVEELNEPDAAVQFLMSAVLEFARRVEKTKKNKFSTPINICQNYIFNHIYENISLTHLAELVNMTPKYLSQLFKKEVGITLTEYIQQAKIEEVKNLITFTSYPLTKISNMLNFSDQSYFTKVFKKYVGITPKKYKSGLTN
ncbi:Arabinose operon regulatory protein [compost metagenome]